MELECKLAHLRDKFTEVEQSTNDLMKNIKDMNDLKLKVCILYYYFFFFLLASSIKLLQLNDYNILYYYTINIAIYSSYKISH